MTYISISPGEGGVTVGSVNPHCIWIRHLSDSGQAFLHLQSLLIYSINSGIKVRGHAAVSVQLPSARVTLFRTLFLCLVSFFFPLQFTFLTEEGENLRVQPIAARTAACTDGV